MYKRIFFCFIFITAVTATVRAGECTRYGDSEYRYSLCAPREWKKSYQDIGYKHFFTLTRAPGAEICVTAMRFDDEEKSKWDSWKKWYVRGIGNRFTKIIETRELASADDVTIKVIVFDYTARGTRMLQRTMLSKWGDAILVIECRAPLRSFSRYTDQFNLVMSSVDYTGSKEGERMEDVQESKKAVSGKREKAAPKPAVKGEKKKAGSKIKKEKPAAPQKPDPSRGGSIKGEDADVNLDSIGDPEEKKTIEDELQRVKELQQKGVLEKVNE